MIKAIIFDVGGVLYRTLDQSPRQKLADEYGLTYKEINYAFFGGPDNKDPQLGLISWEEHFRNLCAEMNIDLETGKGFIDRFFGGDQLNLALIEAIRELKKEYRIAILSNAMTNLDELLVKDWKISDLFEVVVNSSIVGVMKPDKRIYEITLQKLGLKPEETVFIDDMPENIYAAEELGMHGIRFIGTDQTITELNELLKVK